MRVHPVLSALALATLTLPAALAAAPASAAHSPAPRATPAIGTPAGYGDGYNNVIGSTGVFSHYMRVGATKVFVYCLVQAKTYASSGTYHAVAPPPVPNVALADDIAAHSATIGTPLADPNMEAVAIQLAIWHETGNFNIASVPNAQIDARANVLVAGATPLTPGILGETLAISIPRERTTDAARLAVIDTTGHRVAGQRVRVSAPGLSEVVVAGGDGNVYAEPLTHPGVLRASWSYTLPAGTVMETSSSADQPLVTAAPATVPASATARIAFARPTTPTTVPPAPATGPTAPSTPTTVPVTTTTRPHHHRTTPTTVPITPTTLPPTTTTTLPPATGSSSGHSSSTTWILLILALLIVAILVARYLATRRERR